jgi:hypothetical protein
MEHDLSSLFDNDAEYVALTVTKTLKPRTRRYVEFPLAESDPTRAFLTDGYHLKPLSLFQHKWFRVVRIEFGTTKNRLALVRNLHILPDFNCDWQLP